MIETLILGVIGVSRISFKWKTFPTFGGHNVHIIEQNWMFQKFIRMPKDELQNIFKLISN